MEIQALQKILSESVELSEQPLTQPCLTGSETVVKMRSTLQQEMKKKTSTRSSKPSDIWSVEEVPTEESLLSMTNDHRINAKYDFSYKDEVGVEHSFLKSGSRGGTTIESKLLVSCVSIYIQNMIYMAQYMYIALF